MMIEVTDIDLGFNIDQKLFDDKGECCCPISKELYSDPVFCQGFTYERSKIEEWFSDSNRLPDTNEELSNEEKRLVANSQKKSEVTQFREKIAGICVRKLVEFTNLFDQGKFRNCLLSNEYVGLVDRVIKRGSNVMSENSKLKKISFKCYKILQKHCNESLRREMKSKRISLFQFFYEEHIEAKRYSDAHKMITEEEDFESNVELLRLLISLEEFVGKSFNKQHVFKFVLLLGNSSNNDDDVKIRWMSRIRAMDHNWESLSHYRKIKNISEECEEYVFSPFELGLMCKILVSHRDFNGVVELLDESREAIEKNKMSGNVLFNDEVLIPMYESYRSREDVEQEIVLEIDKRLLSMYQRIHHHRNIVRIFEDIRNIKLLRSESRIVIETQLVDAKLKKQEYEIRKSFRNQMVEFQQHLKEHLENAENIPLMNFPEVIGREDIINSVHLRPVARSYRVCNESDLYFRDIDDEST